MPRTTIPNRDVLADIWAALHVQRLPKHPTIIRRPHLRVRDVLRVAQRLRRHVPDDDARVALLVDLMSDLTIRSDWTEPCSGREMAELLGIKSNHLATLRSRGQSPRGWTEDKVYKGGRMSGLLWALDIDEIEEAAA